MPASDLPRARVLVVPWERDSTPDRVASGFRVSWSSALNDLDVELHLAGWADALVFRARDHPGIVVQAGGYELVCDRYADGPAAVGMSANLRAITRTIRALRQIERDGVSVKVHTDDQLSPPALLAP